jgi:hypothetical protein
MLGKLLSLRLLSATTSVLHLSTFAKCFVVSHIKNLESIVCCQCLNEFEQSRVGIPSFYKLQKTAMANALIRHLLTCGVLLINPLLVITENNDPCTVCPNGDPITLPEKALSLPGIDSCGTLDSTIGLFFQSDADECAVVHSVSSICGCPIPEGACYLCGENSLVQKPDLQVPYLFDSIDGLTPTCEIIEAYLHSISETDPLCAGTNAFAASYCGCSNSPPKEVPMCTLCPRGEAVPDANRTLSIEGIPFETCGDAEQALALYLSQGSDVCNSFQVLSSLCGCETSSSVESPCSICIDGSPAALPDVDLSALLEGTISLGSDLGGIKPTCRVIEAAVRSVEKGSQECQDVRYLAGACGCPPIENACDFCPGEDVDFPDKEVQIVAKAYDVVPTCGQIDAVLTQFEKSSLLCYESTYVNYICGCNGGERRYLGAETRALKVALAWVPRFSASLSLSGSSMIIYDILRDRSKRGSVFHNLMMAMSLFDIVGSLAWSLSTLPIPEYEFGEPSGIYGARGNEVTCKLQGFFIQLGYTSIFYNMSLSFYFLLVVRYGMRENQLQRLQLWLHIPALIVGFALAFGGIPVYGNSLWSCYIPPPPLVEDYYNFVIFAAISTAIAILTVNTILVYWAVRKRMIAARTSRMSWMGRNVSSSGGLPMNPDALDVSVQLRRREMPEMLIQKMERQTFWQALFYLGAFYLTWPILLAPALITDAGLREGNIYPFYLTVITLAPLQGFLNFLVYARPRILQRKQRLRGPQSTSRDNSRTLRFAPIVDPS